jgi:prepilin-type N-terminal cleavage/methylation domain-containing protein
MELPKTSTNNRGFTLIEVILVIGLFLIVCTLSITLDMKTLYTHSSYDDVDTLLSTLRTARTRSLTNQCAGVCTDALPHGVYFEHDHYTLFQGNSYDPYDSDNEITQLSPHTHIEGVSTLIFLPRSATATTTPAGMWNIDLIPSYGATTTININSEGRISID